MGGELECARNSARSVVIQSQQVTQQPMLQRWNRFYFTTNQIQSEDLEALKEMQLDLFPVRYSDSFYENLLRDDFQTILAYTLEDQLVGVATARVTEGNSSGLLGACRDEVEGYIMTLGVASSCRRMGLGSQLLKMIVDLMMNIVRCDVITLHVKVPLYLQRKYLSLGTTVGWQRRGPSPVSIS